MITPFIYQNNKGNLNNLKNKSATGKIIILNPPNTSKRINAIIPNPEKYLYIFTACSDFRLAYIILEPSNGGIGIRLKTANTMLRNTAINKKYWARGIPFNGRTWKAIARTIAKDKFESGPDIATNNIWPRVRIEKFTGTGLAYPKCAIKGRIIVPNKSI